MNTKYDIKFLESRWAAHFSSEEKEILKNDFSARRIRDLSLKQKKPFIMAAQINNINYHQILNVPCSSTILVVGGEGKSVFKNSKTFNIYPDSRANIIGDINHTCFKDQTFDVVFFERVGFCESILGSRIVNAELHSLEECNRILKSQGRLIIITGIMCKKTVNDLLWKSGKWTAAPEMIILESQLTIDKYVTAKNNLIYTPLHFFKSQKEINDKK